MKSPLATIHARRSVRTYDGAPLAPDERQAVQEILSRGWRGPFGHEPRFTLVDTDGGYDGKAFGTYGFIQNPRAFIVGAVAKQPRASTDYGYCLEHLILELTELGLGTCWLGGTFTRSLFAKAVNLAETEMLPCITPVGRAAERSMVEKVVRFSAGADKRKPFGTLFLRDDAQTPDNPEDAGVWAPCLEAVRIGPSASNRQPWRVIRRSGNLYFFLARNKLYDSMVREASLQEVDLGIAMCHFEVAARASGLGGEWIHNPQGAPATAWDYISTWQTKPASAPS